MARRCARAIGVETTPREIHDGSAVAKGDCIRISK
jgi:hypothetical protein